MTAARVAGAHDRGLRVLVDLVPNHTSDRHPWFVESRADRTNPKRDWYWWRDGRDGGPPTNWRATFTGEHRWEPDADGQLRPTWVAPPPADAASSAWTLDPTTDQWYLHTFLPQQPDLNWRNPAVAAAVLDVVRFWSARGVDGFRVDAIRTVGKPDVLTDVPPEKAARPQSALTDVGLVDEVIGALRAAVDAEGRDLMLLGEVHSDDLDDVVRHVGDGLFTQVFGFPLMFERWDAAAWARQIDAVLTATAHRPDARISWVLSNHDEPRVVERYGSEARARAALVAMLGLPGSAVLYQGDELGLRDAVVPAPRQVDPGGRDGCRAPLPWTAPPDLGWPAGAWLPFPAAVEGHDAAAQRADPSSTYHLCRAALAARRASPALRRGSFEWRVREAAVLAWRRAVTEGSRTDERVVVVNARDEEVALPAAFADELRGWVVEVSTRPDTVGGAAPAVLGPDEAVVLRPAAGTARRRSSSEPGVRHRAPHPPTTRSRGHSPTTRRPSVLLRGAAVLAGAALGLTACGSDDAATAPTSTAPTSTAPTSTGPTSTGPTNTASTSTPSTDPPSTDPPSTTSTADPSPDDTPPAPTTAPLEVPAGSVLLPLGEAVALDAVAATATLVEITEDSRCPPEVMCVWEGELAARVRVEPGGGSGGGSAVLDLVWAYHAEPTPIPGTTAALALDDASATAVVVRVIG